MKRMLYILGLLVPMVLSRFFSQAQPMATGQGTSYTKIDAPSIYASHNELSSYPTATINIDFATDVPTAARAPIQEAANIWSYLIHSQQTITIRIEWAKTDGGALAATASDTLQANFPLAPKANILYPVALAEALSNQNLNGARPEMTIVIDSTQTHFYYLTDGNTSPHTFDLMSIVLHEIAHGLGFSSSFNVTGLIGRWGALPGREDLPTVLDDACVVGNNRGTSIYRLTNGSQYPNQSQALGDQLKSKNVFFDGLNAYQMDNSSLPKLYAPSTWAKGSSITHLDESTYTAGTSNSLMTPTLDTAESVHSPGELSLAMLQDLGWTVNRLITFTKPIAGMIWQQGQADTIRWTDNKYLGGPIDMQLWVKNTQGQFVFLKNAVSIVSNQGANSAIWTPDVGPGTYRLQAMLNAGEGYGMTSEFSISNLPQVAGPVFTPGSGSYPGAQTVAITCGTSGATIHYTTDGSAPTEVSPSGTSVSVPKNMTLKAKAFKTNYNPSIVSTAVYKIGPQAAPAQITPDSGPAVFPLTVFISWDNGLRCYYSNSSNGAEPLDPFANGTDITAAGTNPFLLQFSSGSIIKFKVGTMLADGSGKTVVNATFTIVPGLHVSQVDSAGVSFGTWSRWDNIAHWRSFPDTTLIRPTGTTSFVLKASQDFKPNTTQKYQAWTQLNATVTNLNHAAISVDQNTTELVARFKPANSVTLQSLLIDGGNPSGSLNFRDPWQTNFNEVPYGWRNRAVDAVDTLVGFGYQNLGTSSMLKGVFLGIPIEAGKPYYSVGAPATQAINGFPSGFMNWTGVGVAFQNSTAPQTGIVFQQPGATATAMYKAHLGSSVANPTGSGTQRKVAKAGTTYHMVYESANNIYYASSTDNGVSWSNEQRVSDNSWGTRHYNPSLFIDPQHYDLYLVYEVIDGSYHDVVIRWKPSGQAWQTIVEQDMFNATSDLAPVIEGIWDRSPSDLPRIVVALKATGYWDGNDPGLYYIYLDKSSYVVAKVPETSSTSVSPALTWMNLAYQDGNAIYHKHYTYSSGNISFESKQQVSSNYVNGRLVTSIQNPSIDIRVETGSERRPVIAWQATDLVFQTYRPIFVRHSVGGRDDSVSFVTTVFDWGTPNAKGRTPVVTACYSGTYTNPDVAAVWQHDPSDPTGSYPYVVAVNKINGSFGNQVTLTTNARYCTSVQGYALQSNGGALAAWTGPTGPIFSIIANQGTNGTLSKTGAPRFARGMDVDLSELKIEGLSGTLSAYIEETDAASIKDMKSLTDPVGEYLSLQAHSSRTPSVPYRIALYNATFPHSPSAAENQLALCSLETGQPGTPSQTLQCFHLRDLRNLWENRTQLESSSKVAETKGTFTGLLNGSMKISLNAGLNPAGRAPKLYEFVLNPDSSSLQKELANAEPVPRAYELQANYPNPFNPSTTICFALPEVSHVRLQVFDVLGRMVSTLANGEFPAGYHNLVWDARANGQTCASGIYFARLLVTDATGKQVYTNTNKLLLTK